MQIQQREITGNQLPFVLLRSDEIEKVEAKGRYNPDTQVWDFPPGTSARQMLMTTTSVQEASDEESPAV